MDYNFSEKSLYFGVSNQNDNQNLFQIELLKMFKISLDTKEEKIGNRINESIQSLWEVLKEKDYDKYFIEIFKQIHSSRMGFITNGNDDLAFGFLFSFDLLYIVKEYLNLLFNSFNQKELECIQKKIINIIKNI
tara:strand:- start:741 stop:1142 length:402 start_codon:yes stop_codon:yes gene_type:complete